MGMNEVIAKAMVKWHVGMRGYYGQLQECCLDSMMKAKLQRKITYHTLKLRGMI